MSRNCKSGGLLVALGVLFALADNAQAAGERLSAGASKGSYQLNETIVIQGVLQNAARRGFSGIIVVNDGLAGRCTTIQSNGFGTFTYNTMAARRGASMVQFRSGTGIVTVPIVVQSVNAAPVGVPFIGKPVANLQAQRVSPLLDPTTPPTASCANVASWWLQSVGNINQHSNTVLGLAVILQNAGWRIAPVNNARPGDVLILSNGAHVLIVAANNGGGRISSIGANNINGPAKPQVITQDNNWIPPAGSYVLTPP